MTKYIPIGGLFWVIFNKLFRGKDDIFEDWEKLFYDQEKDIDVIVANGFLKTNSSIVLRDPKLVKEYFSKEMKIAERDNAGKHIMNLGFFSQNGPHAMKMRAIFADFFA